MQQKIGLAEYEGILFSHFHLELDATARRIQYGLKDKSKSK
jgi:hypothetical protein